MTDKFQIVAFPRGHEAQIRGRLNDAFPELIVDPIDIVAEAEAEAYSSVFSILKRCDMHPGALEDFATKHAEEFTTIIPVDEKSPVVRFMIEHGSGHPVSVVPISFLARLGRQISAAVPEMADENILRTSSRMTHAYALGLLAYDVVDPWKLVENPVTDEVTRKLAGKLLCIGIDDGLQGEPPKETRQYMKSTLPARVAATLAYMDLQNALTTHCSTTDEAQNLVERFLERRIEAVGRNGLRDFIALSEIDHAFAHPLPLEDLQSFMLYASIMAERGLIRPLFPADE